MKSLLTLVDNLNQAALDSGVAHGTRGVGAVRRRALDKIECDAAAAVQDRIAAIIAAGPGREVLELIEGDGS